MYWFDIWCWDIGSSGVSIDASDNDHSSNGWDFDEECNLNTDNDTVYV